MKSPEFIVAALLKIRIIVTEKIAAVMITIEFLHTNILNYLLTGNKRIKILSGSLGTLIIFQLFSIYKYFSDPYPQVYNFLIYKTYCKCTTKMTRW